MGFFAQGLSGEVIQHEAMPSAVFASIPAPNAINSVLCETRCKLIGSLCDA